MELNCGVAELTMGERSRVMCAGGEAALLVSALLKPQLASLAQVLMKHPMLIGDDHNSRLSELVDAENDGCDEDEDEEEGEDEDYGKTAPKTGPNGVGENGNSEEDEEEGEAPNEEDDDGEDDDEEDVGEDNEEEEEDDDDVDEDEEEEEEEEALQPPPKKRKK